MCSGVILFYWPHKNQRFRWLMCERTICRLDQAIRAWNVSWVVGVWQTNAPATLRCSDEAVGANCVVKAKQPEKMSEHQVASWDDILQLGGWMGGVALPRRGLWRRNFKDCARGDMQHVECLDGAGVVYSLAKASLNVA